jgi:spectinomycin phosphotransferase
MFIGGGQGFKPYDDAAREVELFYEGYDSSHSETEVDAQALAYYRYERAVTDLAVDGERVLSPTLGDQDRAQSLEILGFYFVPGSPLEMAQAVDAWG